MTQPDPEALGRALSMAEMAVADMTEAGLTPMQIAIGTRLAHEQAGRDGTPEPGRVRPLESRDDRMMAQRETYPGWICCDCGEKHGRPSRREACMHIGSPCGWCGRDDVPVTQPRDYGWPKGPEGRPG